jgi:hypothetical protein
MAVHPVGGRDLDGLFFEQSAKTLREEFPILTERNLLMAAFRGEQRQVCKRALNQVHEAVPAVMVLAGGRREVVDVDILAAG